MNDVMPRVGDLDEGHLKNIELIIDPDLLGTLVRRHCSGDFENPQYHANGERSKEQTLAEQFVFVCNNRKTRTTTNAPPNLE